MWISNTPGFALDEDPANKKVISILHLSLGEPARKQFMDKYPHTALWDLKAKELITLCIDCFQKKRNRTLDRHRFFSRHQQQGESLSILACPKRARSIVRLRGNNPNPSPGHVHTPYE